MALQIRKQVSTPAVITNRLVAFASEDGTLYSVTKRDRDLLFQFETDAPLSAPPVVFRDSLLLASEDFKVYSIGLNNGRYNWQFSTGSAIISAPIILGNEAYITRKTAACSSFARTLAAPCGRPPCRGPSRGEHRADPRLWRRPARQPDGDRRASGAIERVMRIAPFSRHVVNTRSDGSIWRRIRDWSPACTRSGVISRPSICGPTVSRCCRKSRRKRGTK